MSRERRYSYILSHTDPLTANENGTLMKQELLPIYAEHLVEKIRQGIHSPEEKPLQGFRIIVDAVMGLGASLRSSSSSFGR